MLQVGCVTQFLAPVLEGTIHLVVFRAAATGMVHRDDGGRGIEPSSRGSEGRIRSQSLSLFSLYSQSRPPPFDRHEECLLTGLGVFLVS